MAPGPLTAVLVDPHAVADEITRTQFGVDLSVVDANEDRVIFVGSFDPPNAFAAKGYPREQARILVTAEGQALAFPVTDVGSRTWRHRNGRGDLCLWYAEDPRALRWEWDDGFDSFVAMVHRHLVYEEYFRRHGHWPVEEAPHGPGDHRIERLETHWMRMMWNRP